jgi:hypothetical protein
MGLQAHHPSLTLPAHHPSLTLPFLPPSCPSARPSARPSSPQAGCTALNLMIQKGSLGNAHLLLFWAKNLSVNVNLPDNTRATPLHSCVQLAVELKAKARRQQQQQPKDDVQPQQPREEPQTASSIGGGGPSGSPLGSSSKSRVREKYLPASIFPQVAHPARHTRLFLPIACASAC